MFIRYNETTHIWEYDSSLAKAGGGPWLILPNISFLDKGAPFTVDQTINANLTANVVIANTGLISYAESYLILGIRERNRTVRLGEWQDNPFNAADFTAAAGAWTVTVLQANRYTLIGKTLIWALNVQTSTISIATDTLYVKLPGGFTATNIVNTGTTRVGFVLSSAGPMPSVMASSIGDTRVRILSNVGNFPVGSLSIFLTFITEIL